MIAKQSLKFLKANVASLKGKVPQGISKKQSLAPRSTGRLSRVDLGPKPAQAFRSVRAREQHRLATYPLGYQLDQARKRVAKLSELLFPVSSPASRFASSPTPGPAPWAPQPWSPSGSQVVTAEDDGDLIMCDDDNSLMSDGGDVFMSDAPEEETYPDDGLDMEDVVFDDAFDDGDIMMKDAPGMPTFGLHSYQSHTRDYSVNMVDVR